LPTKTNDSRDLTTPLSWIRGLGLATINKPAKFGVLISTHLEDMKSDAKCRERGGFG